MNVLVLGSRAIATLHLCKILSRKGYRIFIADTYKGTLTSYSNSIQKSFIIPSPRFEFEGFDKALKKIIHEENIKALIPTCEEVFYVGKLHKELSKFCNVFTMNIDVLNQLHNKYKFISYINPYFKTPKTEILNNVNQLNNFNSYIIKPIYSRFGTDIFSNENIKGFNFENSNKNYLIQEKLKGKQVCSTTFVNNGNVIFNSFYEAVHKGDNGAGISFKKYNDKLLKDKIERFVKTINYNGFISFDFFKNDVDNEYYPIECNPRLTSGIHFALDTFSLSEKNNYVTKNDFFSIKTLLLPQLIKQIKLKSSKDLFKSKDVLFDKTDMLPWINQFKCMMYFLKLSREKNIDLTASTTYDIEWNGD